MDAVGSRDQRHIDAIVNHQRTPVPASAALIARASSIIWRVAPCLSRNWISVAPPATTMRVSSLSERPFAALGVHDGVEADIDFHATLAFSIRAFSSSA
jgi:hypothetical protein